MTAAIFGIHQETFNKTFEFLFCTHSGNLSNQTHKRKSHLFAEVLKPLPSTSFVTYRYWILPHTFSVVLVLLYCSRRYKRLLTKYEWKGCHVFAVCTFAPSVITSHKRDCARSSWRLVLLHLCSALLDGAHVTLSLIWCGFLVLWLWCDMICDGWLVELSSWGSK